MATLHEKNGIFNSKITVSNTGVNLSADSGLILVRGDSGLATPPELYEISGEGRFTGETLGNRTRFSDGDCLTGKY